jgi:serine protease Do
LSFTSATQHVIAVDKTAYGIVKSKLSKLLDATVDVIVSNRMTDSQGIIDGNKKDLSDGSGFIVGENGYIFTNSHVIDSAEKIEIVLKDGSKYVAKVVGKDERSDIALLKIDVDIKLPVVEFADSDSHIEVLDPVVIVGNPLGFGKTVTCGVVSCEKRDLSPQMAELGKGGDLVSYVQIDASVNYGNSGGPVFNVDGKMVGMVTVFIPDSRIAFIIPHNVLKRAFDDFVKSGRLNRSWIGISVGPVFSADVSIALGLGKFRGCLVREVESNSPATMAGIQVNDILLSINKENLTKDMNLEYTLSSLPIGDVIPVKVRRAGNDMMLSVKVSSVSDDSLPVSFQNTHKSKIEVLSEKVDGLSVEVADLTDDRRRYYDIPSDINGILVTNVGNVQSEMSVGNLITMVNQTVVSSVEDLRRAMKKLIAAKAGSFALYIYDPYRQEKNFYVAFKLRYSK